MTTEDIVSQNTFTGWMSIISVLVAIGLILWIYRRPRR